MNALRPIHVITCSLLTLCAPLLALEIRTWTSTTGTSIEAEFVRIDGDKIVLKDKNGREMAVKRAQLSQGDLRYLDEVAPKSGTPMLGEKPTKPGVVANPAKEAKIDQKSFIKRTETFKLPDVAFNVLETPHFLVMYPDKVDAADLGETAERMWLDMAFFHPGFAQKFKDRRMAVFIVEEDYDYEKIGAWYADMIRKSEQQNADTIANGLIAQWKQAAAGSLNMTQEIADQYSVLRYARVFRASMGNGSKKEKVKGVFVPFRVHCLASDMVNIQTGGVSGFGSKGLFAISTGHAYFKEILIAGRSETGMLRTDGGSDNQVTSTGGFDPGKNWADELKKLLRRDKVKPSIDALYNATLLGASPELNVLAYSFSRYLQSNTERMAHYAKLLEQIDASKQIPEAEDLAKLYGFADTAAMEADWITWLGSSGFK